MAQTAFAKEVEEAIHKRLFYDGQGTGEDKKLVNIIRSVSKLFLVEQSEEEYNKLLGLITKEINASLGVLDKQMKVSARCDKTMEFLEQAIVEQGKQIEATKTELDTLYLELKYVDKLKEVSAYPDCPTTEKAIKEVERRKDKLMAQLRRYKQHMDTIQNSCHELRQVLEYDKIDLNNKIEDNKETGMETDVKPIIVKQENN